MQTFYVSLVKDLLGVYIEYEADDEETLRKYLELEYFKNGEWRLPWCGIYDTARLNSIHSRLNDLSDCGGNLQINIVKAKCGKLKKENF